MMKLCFNPSKMSDVTKILFSWMILVKLYVLTHTRMPSVKGEDMHACISYRQTSVDGTKYMF